MANAIKELSHAAERAAIGAGIDKFLKNLNNADDRRQSYLAALDLVAKFLNKSATKEKLDSVRKEIMDPNNRWFNLIDKTVAEADPHYAKNVILDLGYECFLRGTKTIRESREKYDCNIPWLILFDPTMACNMHCEGCWSGTYGHKSNLSYEDMDKIVTQGKELGTHLYFMTGGEPTVRMKDIYKLAKKHNDCFFGMFTNSTLINDEMCKKVVELGNITFLLSIEGTPETNDARRGDGHYAKVIKAMDLLHKYGIIFGTSICYTKYNWDAVTNPEFMDFIASKGARFGFYFHYMPVGNNAVVDLMPTPEQRVEMIKRIRGYREADKKLDFYPMDFQNDGEYVGGCIAGGRNYFHINAMGDAEPCVFIHFSNTNIHDNSILEMLQSPLFKAYHEGQPFNRNHLRPCPMLENPDLLRKMVKETGAHGTNEESAEDVDHLCAKCDDYAKTWAPVAKKVWDSETHKRPKYENYTKEKREHPELAAFEKPGDVVPPEAVKAAIVNDDANKVSAD
ncbi:MAG: radical SAM protein [Catonella sp.]|jgi:MoaA/NifB/PqqE/SkfB family radical SAM enzyme|nr:radical SAM protein [Catonella sp.]MDY6357015.1 radical SAM protein [Catonella sp.]